MLLQSCVHLVFRRRLQRRFYAIRPNGTHFHKPVLTAEQTAAAILPNSTLLVGGFGLTGVPEKCLEALARRWDLKNLTIITNDAGTEDYGVGPLINNGQVKKIIASYVGENADCIRRYFEGKIELCLTPQGSIAEALRAGAAGIPYFFTKAGVGTIYGDGKLINKYSNKRVPLIFSEKKEIFPFESGSYLREASKRGDFALIKAWKADYFGNLVFRETARNFNPVMAKSGRTTFVEVEELVPAGVIDPDEVHLSGIYVDGIVLAGSDYKKRILHLTVSREDQQNIRSDEVGSTMGWREKIARRAATEFKEGMYVNLGIGIPEHASNFIPSGMTVHINSENGVLGLGPFPKPEEVDPDLVNAGKETVTVFSGASYFGSDEAFSMIRGGHFDMSMLGGLEVSQGGDLANWIVPGKMVKGMGGAMDLATSGCRIIVTMKHCTKSGESKILPECTLPLTAPNCVDRIITEKAVFDVDKQNKILRLVEVASNETVEGIKAHTAAHFEVSPELITF